MAIRLFPRGHIGIKPPTGAFTLNRDSPQAKGLVGWWPPLATRSSGILKDSMNRFDGTLESAVTWAINGELGFGLDLHGTYLNNRVSFGDRDEYTSDEFTVGGWFLWRGISEGAWANYIGKGTYLAGEFSAIWQASSNNRLYLNGTQVVSAATVPTAGAVSHQVYVYSRAQNYAKIYLNGREVGTAAYNTAITNTASVFQLNTGPGLSTWGFNGIAGDTRFYNCALTAPEIYQLFAPETRYDLYLPAAPRFWSVPAAGGPVELEVQDATHAHAADSVALIQAHVLSVADASHTHTADAVALIQAHLLAIQNATHAHAVDTINLGVGLVIQDVSHAHTSESPDLIQAYLLAVQDSTHTHTADNIALIQAYLLAVQDASHSHSADNLDLIQAYLLAVADAAHAHTADNVTLSLAALLEVQDVSHAHGADNVDLLQAYLLNVADASHAHAADNPDLLQAFILTVADASHSHTADNVTLSLVTLLEVQDAVHIHTADNPDLIQAHLLAVADALHTHTADNIDLVQGFVLTVADAAHGHTANNVDISFSILAEIVQQDLGPRTRYDMYNSLGREAMPERYNRLSRRRRR